MPILLLLMLLLLLPIPSFASRGCGTTLGSASTDIMTTGTIASTTSRSFFIRFNQNADTGLAGRLFEQSAIQTLDMNGATVRYVANWTGTDGGWTIVAPATGSWNRLGVTYNGSSTTNNPIFYLNGATPTVTTTATPTTALDSGTVAFTLCNTGAANRVMDGMIAEVAMWDSILSAGNMTDLMNGQRPDGIGVTPTHYWKLCGADSPELADVGGVSATITTGTLRQTHPMRNCGSQASATGAGN